MNVENYVIEMTESLGCPPNDISDGDWESININYCIDGLISRYNDPRGG